MAVIVPAQLASREEEDFGNDARARLESWRQDYSTARPHSALGNLTPRAFARQAHEARKIV